MDEYLVIIGTFEIDLICIVKASSNENAKEIVCKKNGILYDELRKNTEMTVVKVDYKEGF